MNELDKPNNVFKSNYYMINLYDKIEELQFKIKQEREEHKVMFKRFKEMSLKKNDNTDDVLNENINDIKEECINLRKLLQKSRQDNIKLIYKNEELMEEIFKLKQNT